jgi:DNA-binding LacI/PurR family transcriptional regulator
MEPLRVLTATEQVAGYLRRVLESGAWGGRIPGGNQLAGLLGVGRNTVEAALQLLETEGVLEAQGAGRRRVVLEKSLKKAATLRVAILLNEESERKRDYVVHLQHLLTEQGHASFFADASLHKLGMDVERVARLVEKTAADAWVVVAGSREVIEWFSAQTVPALAMFGRVRGQRIACAGADKAPACAAATRELIRLDHRRIVLMARAQRRLPRPGAVEQAFLDELAAHGMPVSHYNLPGWEETIPGFHAFLDSLFRVSPPTAMIIDEVELFIATQQFLSRKRLRVPEDVSLICTDQDVVFNWCQPAVSHIRWDSRPLVRRIVRWVNHVSHGKRDVRQVFIPAEFVHGGSIGQARE